MDVVKVGGGGWLWRCWKWAVEVVEVAVGGGGGCCWRWWRLVVEVGEVGGGGGGGEWWRWVVEVENFHWLNMLQVYCLIQIFH